MDQPQATRADDSLAIYLACVAGLNDRFGRIAREQRLLAEEWRCLAGRLRTLAARKEKPFNPG